MADIERLVPKPMHPSPVTVVPSRTVCSDSFNHPSFSNLNFYNETFAHKQTSRLEAPEIPLPAAYTRQLSYGLSKPQIHNPNIYVREYDSSQFTTSRGTDDSSAEDISDKDNNRDGEEKLSNGKRQSSVLIFLRDSRFYIRVIAVLIMLVSLSLILTAIISFTKAQKKDGYPLDKIPKLAPITDQPCVVFSGVAILNLGFSISLLCAACMSSKFKKSNNALNATFTIVSAVGFASSMGACHLLNKQTSLQNDLWKWSCGNDKKGITSDAIDFNLICNVVSYGWKFGLAQAALELLSFIISFTAFVLLKYSYFARYGRFGRVF